MASSGQTQSRMANRSGHFRRNDLILILQKSRATEENAYNDENGHIIGKETIFMLIKDEAHTAFEIPADSQESIYTIIKITCIIL